jgi:hypothetical protein
MEQIPMEAQAAAAGLKPLAVVLERITAHLEQRVRLDREVRLMALVQAEAEATGAEEEAAEVAVSVTEEAADQDIFREVLPRLPISPE